MQYKNSRKHESGQRIEFLHRLRGEAERLLGLIEDILDVTRLESGKLTLKRGKVALTEVARAAIETSRSLALKREIVIDAQLGQDLPIVPIDEVKMRQVIVNLLVNAIKFSPLRTTVTVRATREPKFLLLEVTDRGQGISPEDATHIFELFGQGVASQEQRDVGVGIGLHLVKRITELHGGHVGVNSRVGEGSTFWVRLPLALADADPAEPERMAA
jgi:signal transduction histidine kinase